MLHNAIGRFAVTLVIAIVALAAWATAAHADFGFDGEVRALFHQPQDVGIFQVMTPEGTPPPEGPPPLDPDTQAGGHPDFTLSFELNTKPTPPGSVIETIPDEALRDVDVDMPAGFYGNPQNRPTCTWDQFVTDEESIGGTKVGGYCDKEAQVGVAVVRLDPDPTKGFAYKNVVPVYNMRTGDDEAAVLAFALSTFPTKVTITPRTDGDYGLRASLRSITQTAPIYGTQMILWGDPSDPKHDRLRRGLDSGLGWNEDFTEQLGYPSTSPRLPFLTAPARCDAPLETTVSVRSWTRPERTVTATSTLPARTGCDRLEFDADVAVKPTSAAAGQPSGYGIDVRVPQTNSIDQPAVPQVRDVTVRFPEGTAISPAAADGLQACTDEQLGLRSREPERCPDASKLGKVTIGTPLLTEPLEGAVYLGTQRSQDPASGEMYRAFIVGSGKGVRIKLHGGIKADPRTGQLTAVFEQNPQLPFESLRLQLDDGPRAVFVNSTTCGTKTASSTVSSYADTVAMSESSFVIDQGCPSGHFAPGFTAGTLNPFAGAYSPFVMTTTRSDADQDLLRMRLDLPSGLLGALGTVPVCAEAQAAAGSCAASTRLGSTTVAVGSGANPFSLGGTVSLAGPYKGQPYSLAIAVPAKAGPLDLGMVVVRAPLVIDATNAKVSAPVDDLPQIVGGVPLRYRSISVALDRPGFMWNATSCNAQSVAGTFTSVGGAVAKPNAHYQARGCDKLAVDPDLALRYANKAELKKDRHPAIEADLADTFGHANLKTVEVTLPLTASLDPDNANALCEPNAAAARNCPAASIVGTASASTIALHEPLTGPVYFVRGERKNAAGKTVRTLPKLYLKLRGSGVEIDLHADSDVEKDHLVTTFRNIPDVPLRDFKLRLNGGKNGIIVAVNDPCAASKDTTAVFTGHNGGITRRALKFTAPECAPAISTATGSASKVTVRVGGIGAGKLSISGPQVRSASRTIKASDAGQVTARTRLTKAQKRLLARGRSVKVAVRVTFTPKAGKTVTFKRTITIAGVKRSSRR